METTTSQLFYIYFIKWAGIVKNSLFICTWDSFYKVMQDIYCYCPYESIGKWYRRTFTWRQYSFEGLLCIMKNVLCVFYICLQVALVAKKLPACVGDIRNTGSIPGLGRSLEKGMASHSSILAWRSPMDRGGWQATGLTTWLSDLAADILVQQIYFPKSAYMKI